MFDKKKYKYFSSVTKDVLNISIVFKVYIYKVNFFPYEIYTKSWLIFNYNVQKIE